MQRVVLLLLVGLLACGHDSERGTARLPATETTAARTPVPAPGPLDSARPRVAEAPEHLIPTAPEEDGDYYPWIRALSSGPNADVSAPESDSVTSRMYRVAVLVSEIYDTVILEELTFGVEGCCATIRRVRRLDLDAFVEQFGFRGEIAGFALERWVGPDRFEFHFRDRRFRATSLGRDTLRVTELGAL